MYINTLYGSTYSAEKPITAHIQVSVAESSVRVDFTEDECAELQAICVRAWERKQAAIAQAILADTPAVRALPAPSDDAVDAEFEEA